MFGARSEGATRRVADGETCFDGGRHSSRYLTDGVNLYRCVGEMPSGMGQMVALENCRSLDVTLLPVGEVRSRRLRVVIPLAPGGEQAGLAPVS